VVCCTKTIPTVIKSPALGAYTQHGDRLLNWVLRGTLRENCEDIIENIVHSADIPFKYAVYDKHDFMVLQGLEIPVRSKLLDDRAITDVVRKNSKWFGKRENLIPFIIDLLRDISDIIYMAPRPLQNITLYRGIKSEHTSALQFTNRDFLSTSLNPYASILFTEPLEKDLYSMLYELTVGPDIPCLFLQEFSKFKSSEFEVLLPPGVHFTMEKRVRIKMQVQREVLQDTLKPDDFLKRVKDQTVSKRRLLVIHGKTNGINRDALSARYIHKKWAAR